MAFHAAAILSGLAYLALCLLAAGARLETPLLSPVAQAGPKDHRTALACLIVLPAWLGIPPGTLPAFVAASWSGAAALACLAVSCACDHNRRAQPAHGLQIPLRLALALAACAWYARQRGVPGDLLSLDTYVAMPLAGLAEGTADAAGLIVLGLGALPLGGGKSADLAASLRHLTGLAVWICLFLPMCPGRDLGLGALSGFALDGLYFWGKILILDCVLRLAPAGAPPHLPAIQAGFAGAGAALLCFG
jgi:hypothetical protein